MNRKGFLAELRSLLSFMDAEDRLRVMSRYEALFDEAGVDGEEDLIRSLGSPIRQVLKIERQYREELKAEAEAGETFVTEIQPETEVEPADETVAAEEIPAAEDAAAEEPIYEEPAAEEVPETEAEPVIEQPAEEPAVKEIVPEENPTEIPVEPIAAAAAAAPVFEEPAAEPAAEEAPEEFDLEAELAAEEPASEETPLQSAAEEHFSRHLEEPAAEEAVYEEPVYDEPDYEEPAEEEYLETKAKPGGGRILGAVLVSIPMLAFVLLGIAISVGLGLVFVLFGIGLGAAGVYLCQYIFRSVITYMPDMMLTAGGALLAFCFALLFAWLGIFVAVGGCILTAKITASVYRGILGLRKERDDG